MMRLATMSDRLLGCLFKVDRSIKHLNELNEAGMDFSKTNLGRGKGIVLYGETNREGTKCFIKADVQVRIPTLEWGVLVGDIVYSMRSVLDQAVWLLSSDRGKWSTFPVCSTEKDWVTKSPGQLWGVPEPFVAIIKSSQPYLICPAS
jgi:hypothetical protein